MTTTSEAALALLRALVEEVKASAHDPAVVHVVAQKLHHGIDALETALAAPTKESNNGHNVG